MASVTRLGAFSPDHDRLVPGFRLAVANGRSSLSRKAGLAQGGPSHLEATIASLPMGEMRGFRRSLINAPVSARSRRRVIKSSTADSPWSTSSQRHIRMPRMDAFLGKDLPSFCEMPTKTTVRRVDEPVEVQATREFLLETGPITSVRV